MTPARQPERRASAASERRLLEACKDRLDTILDEQAKLKKSVEHAIQAVELTEKVGTKNFDMLVSLNDAVYGERDPEGQRDKTRGMKWRTDEMWRAHNDRGAQGRMVRYLLPTGVVGTLVLTALNFIMDQGT